MIYIRFLSEAFALMQLAVPHSGIAARGASPSMFIHTQGEREARLVYTGRQAGKRWG